MAVTVDEENDDDKNIGKESETSFLLHVMSSTRNNYETSTQRDNAYVDYIM